MSSRAGVHAGWGARLLRALGLAAAVILVAPLAAEDLNQNIDMVTGASADIKLTVPGGLAPLGGFLPVRVRISNRSPAERTWRFELGSGMWGGLYRLGAQVRSLHSFTVPGDATREFFIFVPVHAGPSPVGVQGRVDGPEVDRDQFSLNLSWGGNQPIAIEPALEAQFRRVVNGSESSPTPPPSRRMGYRSRVNPASLAAIDPAGWPADWRLWSGFKIVILDQATWEHLDSTRRRALLDWVALGGRLVRVNSQESSDDYGAGFVLSKGEVGAGRWSEINDLVRNVANQPDRGQATAAANLWTLPAKDWQPQGGSRWLVGFVLVFGALVGPVNLFLLAPAGKRQRLFFTVPVISIASALLLFVIISFSDGFGGAGTRRAVVCLLPGESQAAVFQEQISRTGLLGARGFALPADTLITVDSDTTNGTATGSVTREGDRAAGDWFTSRTTQRHTLRRLVPTRERVELVSAAGADPVVQTTVTVPLRDFIFRDRAGVYWTAAEVPPGVRVPLVREPGSPSVTHHDTAKYRPANFAAGSFYALAPGASQLVATLPSIRWRDDLVLFTGRLGSSSPATP